MDEILDKIIAQIEAEEDECQRHEVELSTERVLYIIASYKGKHMKEES